jgi:hypothetical protein
MQRGTARSSHGTFDPISLLGFVYFFLLTVLGLASVWDVCGLNGGSTHHDVIRFTIAAGIAFAYWAWVRQIVGFTRHPRYWYWFFWFTPAVLGSMWGLLPSGHRGLLRLSLGRSFWPTTHGCTKGSRGGDLLHRVLRRARPDFFRPSSPFRVECRSGRGILLR